VYFKVQSYDFNFQVTNVINLGKAISNDDKTSFEIPRDLKCLGAVLAFCSSHSESMSRARPRAKDTNPADHQEVYTYWLAVVDLIVNRWIRCRCRHIYLLFHPNSPSELPNFCYFQICKGEFGPPPTAGKFAQRSRSPVYSTQHYLLQT
jgi:hypothetical protein